MAFFPEPECFGLSDRGLQRKENGDHFLVARLSRSVLVEQTSLELEDATQLRSGRFGLLFMVADGLGDTPDAERASALAVDGLLRYALNSMPWFFRIEDYEAALEDELKKAMETCRARLELDIAENPSRGGMGTSLVMAYALWPRLFVVQVGSPRAYVFRDTLRRITRPEGRIIAPGTELSPEVFHATLEMGDILLLATDGLSRHVPDERIAELLRAAPSARHACVSLVDAANEGGGSDNIAVVAARFRKPGDGLSAPAALKAEAPS